LPDGLSDNLLLDIFEEAADFAEFNLDKGLFIADFLIFLPLLSYYTSSSEEL
jgi:hypothetical protein